MAGIRDLNSGLSFEKLKDLGCFDEEFAAYGLGYIEDDQTVYVVDNSGRRMYLLKEKLLKEKIYSTPIEYQVVRRQVDSGTMNDVNQQLKLDFAKKMRKKYGENYFEALQWISEIQNDDTIAEVLMAETKKITGYFDREEIQLFGGLCQLAYECKKITLESYWNFQKWIEYANKQLENEVVTKGKFQIAFYGFGYESNGKLEYYYNAQVLNACKKWTAMRNNSIIVTPILSKTYWGDDLYRLSHRKKDFFEILQQQIDNDYWQKVKKIYLTELQTDKKCFNEKIKSYDDRCSTEEMNSLNLYKFLFNL